MPGRVNDQAIAVGLRKSSNSGTSPLDLCIGESTHVDRCISSAGFFASLVFGVFLLLGGFATSVLAAEVHATLSSREAYVGAPIILQIAISNAEEIEEPESLEISGCQVRSNGAPSQSSQITIINGRRSMNQSVTYQYQITPLQVGEFEVPSVAIKVDGTTLRTERLRFVATKSESGDLLFVEIESSKDKVFVGEALSQTLKIWIKPFRSREYKITLSEANMWQLISDQTSWGSFNERMRELSQNNRRPGGQEVLRKDADGIEHSYYLYEIEATIYPKRPGKIDASDVRIVVDYPTALAKSRDPFAAFGGSAFGNSPLSQLLEDDFFSSPFTNNVTISAVRPIVAEAMIGTTEVIPIPTEGQPADYRGAVGRYKIMTQATPTAVVAGDPITLSIGIGGTGPMELVQAPPLAEIATLTADFKVADESLAGFVQDETKVFSTTIRPLREGITEIPAIPFSYFDPDTKQFATVMSDPIAISVGKSESLALDAIVKKPSPDSSANKSPQTKSHQSLPNLKNDHSLSVLTSQSTTFLGDWYWIFVVGPPAVWSIALCVRHQATLRRLLPSFKSPRARCMQSLERAVDQTDLAQALVQYIAHRTKQPCTNTITSVGALRTVGSYQVASEVEEFYQQCEQLNYTSTSERSLEQDRVTARQLVQRMEAAFASLSKNQIRRVGPKRNQPENRSSRYANLSESTQRIALILITASAMLLTNRTMAKESQSRFTLSIAQRETILKEAGEKYSQATEIADSDSIAAQALFAAAAEKYQLLVDSGISNSQMYKNLGNAYLQCQQIGRAIANYERAKHLQRDDRQLAANLAFANSIVAEPTSVSTEATASELESTLSIGTLWNRVKTMNELLLNLITRKLMVAVLITSSTVFWGLLIVRTWSNLRFAVVTYAALPALLLLLSLGSVLLDKTNALAADNGVVVVGTLALRSGDSDQFETVAEIENADGQRVQILTQRGGWAHVNTKQGLDGWVKNDEIESVLCGLEA